MKIALAIIIAILVIGGSYLLFVHKTQAPVTNPALEGSDTSAPLETTNPNPPVDSTGATSQVVTPVTVTYTDTGFSPKTLNITVGTTVHFVNNSSHGMWVASAVHPTHAAYDGTTLQQHCSNGSSFDECTSTGKSGSYDFTFTKAGTFNYHNHVLANDTGTIVVK
ncbi:MAG: hypothetical protein ACM3TU_02100 [Bacillota bacterium]